MDRVAQLAHGGLKRYRSSDASTCSEDSNHTVASLSPTAQHGLPMPSPRPNPPVDRLAVVSRQIGTDVSHVYRTKLRMAYEQDLGLDAPKLKVAGRLRREVVDFICSAGEHFRLRKATAHVAVQYVDRVLSRLARTTAHEMSLLAVACLRLAAKLEEALDVLPSTRCLLSYLSTWNSQSDEFTTRDVSDMEMAVFKTLDYRMFALTPVHFLELFSSLGLFFNPGNGDCKRATTAAFFPPSSRTPEQMNRETLKDVTSTCEFFVDLAQQVGGELQCANVALMACAVLSCARRLVKVTPVWSRHLETITLFRWDDRELRILHDELWDLYMAHQGTTQQEQVEQLEEEEDFALENASVQMAAMSTNENQPPREEVESKVEEQANDASSSSTAMMISPLGPADLLGLSSSTFSTTGTKEGKGVVAGNRDPLASIDPNRQ